MTWGCPRTRSDRAEGRRSSSRFSRAVQGRLEVRQSTCTPLRGRSRDRAFVLSWDSCMTAVRKLLDSAQVVREDPHQRETATYRQELSRLLVGGRSVLPGDHSPAGIAPRRIDQTSPPLMKTNQRIVRMIHKTTMATIFCHPRSRLGRRSLRCRATSVPSHRCRPWSGRRTPPG